MALKFRRGTTAQQSGSLAFGEPYVNTTLGTLLIGGDTGDIQLATAGTASIFSGASVSASSFISGSSLKITGNASIDGNLTLGGAITIGDATADTVNVVASLSSSLVPSNDNVFNIGSTSFRYANIYATTLSASAYTGLGNLTTYSTSVASRVNTLETAGYAISSSVASATANSISSLSSSVKVVTDTLAVSSSVATATANSISTLSGSVKAVTDTLDGKITTEKGRIDAILSASTADADTFAEIVTLINSVDLTNDNAFASFYTASVGRLNSLESATGSYAVSSSVATATANSISTLSGSVKAVTDTLATSASIASATADSISILSSSIYQTDATQSSNVTSISSSLASRVNTIETTYATSASIATATANSISTLSGSVKAVTDTLAVSSSVATATANSISTLSSSVFQTDATQSVNIATATAAAAGAFASASAYSASAAIIDNAQSVKIASLETNILSASIFTTFSTSVDSRLDSVELLSASANTAYAKLSGNNTYTGNQTVTGSVYVSGDFIVQGTSSLQNITASAVTLGTNTIILNTDTPAVRFAGISVIDSGSNAGTGSLWWDSLANHWVYEHPADSGAPYNSAILISGPKNSGSLGEEVGLMTGYVPVASGDDHITNSIISASLSKVTIQGDLDVTLGISASSIVGLGHVSTYSASVASRVNTIETTYATSASIASATATSISTLSGSVKARTDQTITINGTAVGLGGTLTTAQTLAGAISSSGQVAFSGVTGTVSNAQLANNYIQIAGYNIGLGTAISAVTIGNAIGAFSGSAQVAHDSTTGYSANKHIDHTTVSISAGSGISGGGDISTTRTLTLDTASAHFVSGARAGLSVVDTTGASGIDLTYNAGLGTLSGVLANSSVTINGTSLSLGGSLTTAQVLAGAISSSAQVDGTAIQNKSITINGTSVALGGTLTTAQTLAGAISSSGQVALASTNGFGTYINQALLTTSAVTHGNLTINGTITATGDITAYYTSDKRHKNNIQPITNALQKVSKLNGVTWEWNDDVNEVTKSTPKTGLIAQEVQEVLPEVVVERDNGFLGLDYSKMMGLIVEAIKEQQTQIHKLTLEIEELKKQKGL